MNMVMLKSIQIAWLYGKLNSGILLMELKLLLIPCFLVERLNGMSEMDLSCFFLMVMMDKALSIHQQDLRDSFNSEMKMMSSLMIKTQIVLEWRELTGKLLIQRQLLSISMFWGDNWEDLSGSPWLLCHQRDCWDLKMQGQILKTSRKDSDLEELLGIRIKI